MKRSTRLKVAWFLLTCFLPARVALAHDPGLSSATFTLGAGKLQVAVGLSATDAAALANAGINSGKMIQQDAPAQITERLRLLAPQAFDIKFDEFPGVPDNACAFVNDSRNFTVRLDFAFKAFSKLSVRAKWLGVLPPGHREFFSLQKPGGEILAERLWSASSDSFTAEIDGKSPAATGQPKTSFLDFLAMGVKHILTGYDHLLFLFGLLVVTRNFKATIKIITCFTLAHSLTLTVATMNLVQISSRIVEPLIAVSIVFVGVENLMRTGEFKWRWALTFAFGLIHGFGFASVLRELGGGKNGGSIVAPLFSFNLGVELGQIAIAAVVLPLIWKLRTRPVFVRRWVPACSILVAALGSFWFVQRVWL